MKINLHLELLKLFQLSFSVDSEKQKKQLPQLESPTESGTIVELQPSATSDKKE